MQRMWMYGVGIATMLVTLMGSGCGLRACVEAQDVAHEEFGPRAALKKYEWFKDVAAQLDSKRANVALYAARTKAMDETYAGRSRAEWPRDDREQYNLWQSEVAGVQASYNALVAEYNAQMAKANWKFANVGDLPQGATDPLPREFKPYTTNQ